MRKRPISPPPDGPPPRDGDWLELERLATVEVSSEDPGHPVEGALLGGPAGWRAAAPGPQTIRLVFDEPLALRLVRLRFEEPHAERTQEFVLRWSADGGRSFREVVRQQYGFSPGGATREVEEYRVELSGVAALELAIVPDLRGGGAVASLAEWRLA